MLRGRIADNTSERSLATRLRRQRFQILMAMLEEFEGPVQILDIGGRPQYWEMMLAGLKIDRPIHITLLNTETHSVSQPSFSAVVGDGRAMPQYANHQFDVVFSNSTIEHTGTPEDQKRMADEVRRIGKAYYVQTPNRYFPIEPHFLFPLFQFLPLAVRAWLVNHFSLGWYAVIRDKAEALREVGSIKLLNRDDMRSLFPDAAIHDREILRPGEVVRRVSRAVRLAEVAPGMTRQ